MVQRARKSSRRFFANIWSFVIAFFPVVALTVGVVVEAVKPERKGAKRECSCDFYPKEENEKTRDKKYEYWRLYGRIYASEISDRFEYLHLKVCKKCGGAL